MSKNIEMVPFADASKIKRLRVAAYARVSSGKDAMLHSLSAQVSYYSTIIQGNSKWQYCGVYADEAITGTKDERENFQRMLADCRAGKLDLILTKSISRFARNTVTLLETVRELKSMGIDVYFEEQNIHSKSADGELMLTLLASFAQAESLSVSENMKWRIRKGFENGELMNFRFMFGYDISKKGIEIDPEEAEIVQDIYARFLDGQSMESIARVLNERGIKGTYGGTWTCERIKCLLTNEKYTGNALLQKSYVNNHLEKKKVTNHGELPQYYAEGTHDAIIDMETFGRAQQRISEIAEKTAGRLPGKPSCFTGKIQCGKCGATFFHASNNGKRVWQCSTFRKKGAAACNAKQIPDVLLEQITAEVLGLDEFDPEAVERRVKLILAQEGNRLEFILENGEVIVHEWQNPSRSKSWTPEMKEAARQKRLEYLHGKR